MIRLANTQQSEVDRLHPLVCLSNRCFPRICHISILSPNLQLFKTQSKLQSYPQIGNDFCCRAKIMYGVFFSYSLSFTPCVVFPLSVCVSAPDVFRIKNYTVRVI